MSLGYAEGQRFQRIAYPDGSEVVVDMYTGEHKYVRNNSWGYREQQMYAGGVMSVDMGRGNSYTVSSYQEMIEKQEKKEKEEKERKDKLENLIAYYYKKR